MDKKVGGSTFGKLLLHLTIMAGLGTSGILIFFYVVLPSLTNKDKVVTVPNVYGMSYSEVQAFLESRELTFEVVDSLYNSSINPLAVLEQYPKPNSKVKVGRKINLKLNAIDPPKIEFPDLANVNYELAVKQLTTLDLFVGEIKYVPDFTHNLVMASKYNNDIIKEGQLIPKGSTVDFILSGKDIKFVLPELGDMPLDEVKEYLAGANLRLGEVHLVANESGIMNTVQKQYPAPYDSVKTGDEIELWINKL